MTRDTPCRIPGTAPIRDLGFPHVINTSNSMAGDTWYASKMVTNQLSLFGPWQYKNSKMNTAHLLLFEPCQHQVREMHSLRIEY